MDINKLRGFKGFLGNNDKSDPEESVEDQYYTTSKEEYHVENGIAGSKMILLEPCAYSESQQIAKYLKDRVAVIVNLKRVTPDVAKRIVDFLYGTIFAINGDIQKLGGGIFLCTPNNVKLEGSISDEANQSNSKSNNRRKDENSSEDDFF